MKTQLTDVVESFDVVKSVVHLFKEQTVQKVGGATALNLTNFSSVYYIRLPTSKEAIKVIILSSVHTMKFQRL